MIRIVFDEKNRKLIDKAIHKLSFDRLDGGVVDPVIKLSQVDMPSTIDEKCDGCDVPVQIVGYGRDDYYEAFLVRTFPTDEPDVNWFLRLFTTPKIVISKSAKKPPKGVDVSNLKFWSLSEPFFVDGKLEIKNGEGNNGRHR